MIVQTSDFQLDAYIPNKADAPFSDLVGNETELNGFIAEYEQEALVRVLGYELYAEYIANFNTDGSYKDGILEKWTKLTDGDENYRGIKPLLIGYIFWKFIENDESHYSSSHVVKENSDTSDRVSGRAKAISQYGKFYTHAIGNFYNNPVALDVPSIFGNLKVVVYNGAYGAGSNFKSLYQYLAENEDDFGNWAPEDLQSQNHFDI